MILSIFDKVKTICWCWYFRNKRRNVPFAARLFLCGLFGGTIWMCLAAPVVLAERIVNPRVDWAEPKQFNWEAILKLNGQRKVLLFTALKDRDEATVEKLLTAGLNPNVAAGYSALFVAMEIHFTNAVASLLAHGADANLAEMSGELTPLSRAVAAGQLEIARMLLDHHANPNRKWRN